MLAVLLSHFPPYPTQQDLFLELNRQPRSFTVLTSLLPQHRRSKHTDDHSWLFAEVLESDSGPYHSYQPSPSPSPLVFLKRTVRNELNSRQNFLQSDACDIGPVFLILRHACTGFNTQACQALSWLHCAPCHSSPSAEMELNI